MISSMVAKWLAVVQCNIACCVHLWGFLDTKCIFSTSKKACLLKLFSQVSNGKLCSTSEQICSFFLMSFVCVYSGERDYGPPIDLWGAGCIMAEMWTRSPIMQGNTEQHQLTLISQLCGSITAEVMKLCMLILNLVIFLFCLQHWLKHQLVVNCYFTGFKGCIQLLFFIKAVICQRCRGKVWF